MDRTTIIQAWREVCGSDLIMAMPPTGRMLEKFARKVADIERERCAKLCEAFGKTLEVDLGPNFAEEIRAS